MLERGFLRKSDQPDSRPKRRITLMCNTMLYLGVIILITALIYLLINLDKAEAFLTGWFIIMLAGLFLVVLSHMIKWVRKK